ncbi:MAG TPA: hypothetical protein VLH10_11370, partial [Yinghuangia sp.]|nr:hypothetical protein [Yinghuangia sp.]
MLLVRMLGAAGAVLLTASLTTASSVSAEEPAPTAKFVLDPTTGQIPVGGGTPSPGTGATISFDTPCPETHRYRFRIQLVNADESQIKSALFNRPAADGSVTTEPGFNFWAKASVIPADGEEWQLRLLCYDPQSVPIQWATATLRVSGTTWTAE